ncbi:MAG TPA: glycosyltransferase family 39 protein [Anaerolineae bacterium]|nr:glycosyltransferase family 39 protein [Anaerolineae bacterium]
MTNSSPRPPIDRRSVLLALAALASAVIGHTQNFEGPDRLARIAPWWLLSATLFAVLILYRERPAWLGKLVADAPDVKVRTILTSLAALCSMWAVLVIIQKEDTGVPHYGDAFLFWAIAVGLLLAAMARRPGSILRHWVREHQADVLALTALTGLAAALRFTTLGELPSIIDGDEGLFGMAGLSVSDGGFQNPFGTYHGAGSLYLHLIAGLMRLFGANMLGLRMAPAISGTLAVPAVYLLGRELGGRRVALVAALVVAVSHFHVHFSRIVSVTYLQGTFFNTLALYLLISGLRRDSAPRLMLSGLVIGVYFLLYLDARMMIGVMAMIVLALALIDRALIARNARRLLLLVGVFLIVAAPMLLWAVRHPEEFNMRFIAAGTFENDLLALRMAETGKSAIQIFSDVGVSTFMTLIASPVVDFYFADLSVLNVVSSALFIFGLVYSWAHLRRVTSVSLNVWLWIGIAAIVVFTLDEYGAGYRLLFVFPAVCVLAGVGLDRALDLMQLPARASVAVGGALAVAFVSLNLSAYFTGYLTACRFGGDLATRMSARLGQHLKMLDPVRQAYLLTDGSVQAGTHPSLDFLSGRMAVTNILEPLAAAPPFEVGEPTAFIAVLERAPELETLAQQYPGGRWSQVIDCDRPVFVSYRVEGVAE